MDACLVVHHCALFCNNSPLVHERVVRHIAKYFTSTSTYVDFIDGNLQLSTRGVVYNPDKD